MIPISPGEASVIAKDAFIYGFPMVETYKTLYLHTLDRSGPQHQQGSTRSASCLQRLLHTTNRS